MRRWTGRLAVWALGLALVRVVAAPAEICGDTDRASLERAADEATGWISRALKEDGTYVYLYDLDERREVDDYNIVRHAGVTMSLYQAAVLTGDDRTIATADEGLAYMTDRLVRRDDWAAFTPRGLRPRLGGSSLMLVGLMQRRLATGDPVHDELAAELGRFLLTLQQHDGGFLSDYDVGEGAPVPEVRSLYATGEAFWALTLLDQAFPDEGWREPARAVSHYLATERDRVEDVDWNLWADQWAAYGLAEAGWTLDDDEVDYARRLAQRFGLYLRTEAQRESNPVARLVRNGKASGAGLGVEVEGLASLLAVARTHDELGDDVDALTERVACGAGLLAARQHDGDDPLERGAWFTNGRTQMDDQQHALSGLLLAVHGRHARG